jgi:hypothetical protein
MHVELVRQIGGATQAVAVRGDCAYLGIGPRLVVLDISDPAHPVVIGQSPLLEGLVRDIILAGNHTYVSVTDHTYQARGVYILDIAGPSSPSPLAFHPEWMYAITVNDTIASVAVEKGLRTFDMSALSEPREIGFVEADDNEYPEAVAGHEAYFTVGHGYNRYTGDFALRNRLLDASIDYLSLQRLDDPRIAQRMTVIGRHVYLAAGSSGLMIIDTTDPAKPVQLSTYPAPQWAESVKVAIDGR